MAVNVERIRADIEAIARCTATPGHGATRPTFSPSWAEGRAYVIAQAKAAGCGVRTDAAGNLHARPAGLGWEAKAWIVGSHTDTVPHGGNYDGVAGVVVALELLRSAAEDGVAALPVELIDFAEEEGPTFGLGMLGSRAWVGDLSAERLAELRNAGGQTYLEAGAQHDVAPERLAAERFDHARYRGLIEVHIEQGPGMWRRDQRLAVVTAIAGRKQYAVTVIGDANHAGATAMHDRHDALAGAAEMIVKLEAWTRDREPQVVTVGRLVNAPNAVNVIPDRVEFTIDYRGPDDAELAIGDKVFRTTLSSVAQKRGLDLEVRQTEDVPARPMDARLVYLFDRAGGILPRTMSGALHDSAILSPHLPTVMLFVPSEDGVSHNPAEFSRVEDIAAAAALVERVVRRPTVAGVNAMSREAFVAAFGGVFEHSPWIADRAHAAGPFASLADLHAKLVGVVAAATADEQVGLIAAHPDLVGRLAREGRLTTESTAEQAAAGLTGLWPGEAATFEKFNAAYRDRFGFPFVICARENKKDTILAAFPARLQNTREQEVATALQEIYRIARLRLADLVWED